MKKTGRSIPTPSTGRKRLYAARRARDGTKGKAALSKARTRVRKAEKSLTEAHRRLAYCSTAYNVRSKSKARRRRR